MLEDYHGIAQLKQEGEAYSELDQIISKVYLRPRSARTFADGSHFENGSNMTAEILLHKSGGKTVNYLERIRPASYPPIPQIKQPEAITATEAREKWFTAETTCPARMMDVQGNQYLSTREHNNLLAGLRAQFDMAIGEQAKIIRQDRATIKAKDEIIAGLRDQLRHPEDRIDDYYRKWRLAEADLARVCGERGVLTEANEDLRAKLDRAEEQCRNLHDRLMHACEELDRLKNGEPDKPSTRDMSRLGHFGESHAKNGLSLFDRYY